MPDIITPGTAEVGMFLGSPVEGLTSLYLLDTDPVKCARNFAPRGSNGALVGDPAFVSSVPPTLVGLGSYVQTDQGENPQHTILSVVYTDAAGADDSTRPMFYGTFQSEAVTGGGNAYGTSLYLSGTNSLRMAADRGTSPSSHTASGPTISSWTKSSWRLIVDVVGPDYGRIIDATGVTDVADVASGQDVSVTNATERLLSTGKYRIGSGFTQFAGANKVASWWYFDRAFGNADINLAIAVVRAREARHGRVV